MTFKILIFSFLATLAIVGCSKTEQETNASAEANDATRMPAQTTNAQFLGYVQQGAVTKITDPASSTVCYVAERSGNIALQCLR